MANVSADTFNAMASILIITYATMCVAVMIARLVLSIAHLLRDK